MAKSSGIKVIVVGLGMAGLSAAIECHLQGHTVIGLEKAPQPTHPGTKRGAVSIPSFFQALH